MQIDDIRQMAAYMNGSDWDTFMGLVGDHDARFVYPAVAFTVKYVPDAPVPPEVLNQLSLMSPQPLREWVSVTELAAASSSNPQARDGLGFEIARLLAQSSTEKGKMWLRSVLPRRWNLTKRYPRLMSTPLWPLAYVMLNVDRLWQVSINRARRR
jgi:hypothetical protein